MSDFESTFRELVQEAVKDVPVSVSADDVEGLEDFIDDRKRDDISTDDIEGFDDAVRDAVETFRDKIPDYVQRELDDTIDEKFLNALADHDEVRKAVKQLVKETLQELFAQLMAKTS
jgi:DNA-binding ferritin-like protein (Dps family)